MRLSRWVPFVTCVACSGAALAQDYKLSPDPETIPAFKFATPPKIDGRVGDDEWRGIGVLTRALVFGGTNQDSGEKGQVWIGYDDTYVYIAARIILQNPTKISADEYRDNVDLEGNDSFFIQFDTFGTTHDYNFIAFNANGATSLQIAGGRAAKLEWSGRVEGAATTNERGWEGEVRIPWALMPMPTPGVRDMRFDFDFYVSGTGRGVTSHTNSGDPTKVHTLSGVDVPAVDRGSALLLLPYAYGGYNDETQDHIANAGVDFKTSVTQDMSLVGTINPDFRNIEGDILDLDFSNFERLANETRPFFQEGNDYYFFGHGQRIFASQRIRSFDFGYNLYGNLGGNNRLGFLSTFDFGEQAVAAGSYTFNPDEITEFTGSFSMLQRKDENNTAGRFAASRRFGQWELFGEASHTDDEIEGQGSAFSAGAFYNVPGWGTDVFLQEVSSDYFPRVGFARETDFRGFSANFSRNREYAGGALQSVELNTEIFKYERLDGSHYRKGVELSSELSFSSLWQAETFVQYENFEDRHDQVYGIGVAYPHNSPYRNLGVGTEFGTIDNAWYRSVQAEIRYRPIKRLQLSLRAQSVQHVEKEDQIVFDFNNEIGKYESLGGRVVYNEHEWNWYASYRRSGNLGAEYFLIVGDPNASSFQKTLIFKVSYPLTIKW